MSGVSGYSTTRSISSAEQGPSARRTSSSGSSTVGWGEAMLQAAWETGQYSDRYARFWTAVAAEVAKHDPDAWVTGYACKCSGSIRV